LSILAFVDASYGVHPDGKSHNGLGTSWGRGLFLASSTKQKLVVKSSTEAELVSTTDESSAVIGVCNFVNAQGREIGPAILYQDNQSTMAVIERGRFTGRNNKHVNVRYFFIKNRVVKGELEIR